MNDARPRTPAATAPMSAPLVVGLLAVLLGIQPITTDLYLPALPAITSGFGAPLSQAQLTLTGLLLAFGCSQMVWGPLSDHWGRRPVLLLGLALYTAASVGAALAPTMGSLVGWRVLQGAAMGAVVAVARALVRDLYPPQQGARVLSQALSGLGVIAAVSAPLGGWVTSQWGWRAALGVLTAFGLLALVWAALRLQETLAQPNPQALRLRVLAATWAQVLAHPTFRAYALLATVSYAGLFTFLGASSFVFIDVLGVDRVHYGWAMLAMATSYLAGTHLCRRLLQRHSVSRTVGLAGGLSLACGSLMGALPWLGVVHPLAVLLPFCGFMVAHGIHQPCGQSGAVGPFPHAAGAASALSGLMMMLAAFGVGSWLGWRLDGTVLPLTQGVWFWSAAIAAVAWTLVRRVDAAATVAPAVSAPPNPSSGAPRT